MCFAFSIQENAYRLGKMIQKKPVSSLDQAIGWTEFLAEFRTLDNILPESRNLRLVQYYLLDLLAILLISALLTVWVLYKGVRFLLRVIRSKKQKKE